MGRMKLIFAASMLVGGCVYVGEALAMCKAQQEAGECAICMDSKADANLVCGHTLCWQCLEGMRKTEQDATCPFCRQKRLVEYRVNDTQIHGMRLLDAVVKNSPTDVRCLVLERGSLEGIIDYQDTLLGFGKSPLLLALTESCNMNWQMSDQLKIIRQLLALGADPNVKDPKTGETALIALIKSGQLDRATLLLTQSSKPIDFYAQDKNGKTALDYAKKIKDKRTREAALVALKSQAAKK